MRTTGGFLITHYDQSLFLSGDNREVAWRNERRKGGLSPFVSIPCSIFFLPHTLRIPSALRAHRRLRGDQLGYTLFTSARSEA